jgi:hypothetical protein
LNTVLIPEEGQKVNPFSGFSRRHWPGAADPDRAAPCLEGPPSRTLNAPGAAGPGHGLCTFLHLCMCRNLHKRPGRLPQHAGIASLPLWHGPCFRPGIQRSPRTEDDVMAFESPAPWLLVLILALIFGLAALTHAFTGPDRVPVRVPVRADLPGGR